MVIDNKTETINNLRYLSTMYSCPECFNHTTYSYINEKTRRSKLKYLPSCSCTNLGMEVTGPFWTGPLHDTKFLEHCLDLISPIENKPEVLLYKNIAPDLEIGGSLKQISAILRASLNEGELGKSFYYTWDLAPLFSLTKCLELGRREIL